MEIGAVRFRSDGTVLSESQLPFDPGRIHGITDKAVLGQPTIRDVLPRFAEFVGDGPVTMLAHNATFDVGFLSVECSRYKHTPPDHKVIDTCGLARHRWSLAGM